MPQRQIVLHIPLRGMTRGQWALAVQIELVKAWTESFTPAEMEAYVGACPDGRLHLDMIPARLYQKLDQIILRQAETLGWHIGLSELVHFRFSEWDHEPDGPEMFRKLGLAYRNSALISQRRKLPPIEDPELLARQAGNG